MPGLFFDTSALAKHYHAEIGSSEVDRLWSDPTSIVFVSRLSIPEMISAFAGKVRAGQITAADFDRLTRRFAADARKKSFTTIRQHGMIRQIRTLDAIQLGVALDLKVRGAVTHFVCSDRNLLAVGATEGFAVIDPENP
jgi:predicted nucleic acid-binding protein